MKLNDLLLKEFNLFSVNDFIHPVYYNFPIALRFEIGIGDIWLNEDTIKDTENGNELILNPEYISTAVNRAMTVFSCAFSDNDEVLLVCDCTPSKDFKSILPRDIKMQCITYMTIEVQI